MLAISGPSMRLMTKSRAIEHARVVKFVPHAWCLSLIAATGVAAADPTPPDPAPAPTPSISPLIFVDVPPPPPPPSLRIEAARVAAERFANDNWRYPEPSGLFTLDGGDWGYGAYFYRPRTGRSAALHGGSVAASIAGEILMSAGSPLAGIGALLTGATLDAAAADSDRDAERSRR